MSAGILILTPLARRLEAVMFGPHEKKYRLFEQAVTVVAIGLALAWGPSPSASFRSLRPPRR
ncbi:hypothetical protein ACFQER_07690 [Halomicroarcula sp. GCM10025894]|uniref:hypothetical protein n=1 Tax=Halomicroarcula sp. GCM10025894 TaxID=3252673 RepID=UPI003619D093